MESITSVGSNVGSIGSIVDIDMGTDREVYNAVGTVISDLTISIAEVIEIKK